MNRSDSIAGLTAALAKAQAEFQPAFKETTNPAFGERGRYADLSSIIGAVRPSLNKHGVVLMQFTDSDLERQTASVTTSLHFGDEWISVEAEAPAIGRGDKFDIQSIGACWTYLRRYTLQSLVGVAAEEDDDGNSLDNKNKPIPAKRPSGAISQQPAGQNRGTHGPSQPTSGAQAEFVPPDGIVVTVKSITDIPGKPAEPGKRAVNPYINVHFLESHNGCTSASCFDDKLWPLLKESVGLLCQLQIVEKDSNGKHFINIVEVPFSGGEMFKNGKPVQIFEPEGRNQQA